MTAHQHARLGYVHFKRMQDMSKDGLIPPFDMDTEKCKTCMLAKITKKPFQNVKRKTEVLELFYSDLCDLYATPSLWNKKYFVTFINDASRFCYVYLLHTKDEALDKFKVFKIEVELQQGSLIKRFKTDRGLVPKKVTEEVVVKQPEPELRKSKRNRIPNKFGPEFQLYLIEEIRNEVSDQHSYSFNVEDDPKLFDEATEVSGFHVNLTKEFLSSRLSMKDMREADVIFVSTPMDTSEKLMPNNGQAVSQLEYFRVIGCLMYAMICTRPNIAFAVGKLSRYTSNPSTRHWQEIQRVLKYLKKTIDYSLTYTGYPSVLEGYTDASWIINTEDNSSTSGWVFLLGRGVISWASNKQTCITSSTMEYDFVALATAGKEAEWLRNLILEIPLWSKPIAYISIRCDSATTLAKAYSQMYNGKSRHLGVRHSMIRELITNEVVSIEFVRSQ
ncbi:zinc finger, CCHC-type containing protein [Tanacetum coccineum]|uniref:Zinc finger, CCHC-type containing protein n=1 Tax=Tanacetum coccineum TaxID=301880 RepID=A0ABQ5FSF4_9ASTR